MKIKSLFLICCLSLISSVFAANRHIHPKVDMNTAAVSATKNAMVPGYCEIQINNRSFDNVTVYGTFDDGIAMTPFDIYAFEQPHYISLYYYGYCHRDMYLNIVTFSGYPVYSGYTRADSAVNIVPYLTNQVKAEIKAK